MPWSVIFLIASGVLSLWATIFSVRSLVSGTYARAYLAGQERERELCAQLAEHCAHSCVTKAHCDFLHAAHSELAGQIRARS